MLQGGQDSKRIIPRAYLKLRHTGTTKGITFDLRMNQNKKNKKKTVDLQNSTPRSKTPSSNQTRTKRRREGGRVKKVKKEKKKKKKQS